VATVCQRTIDGGEDLSHHLMNDVLRAAGPAPACTCQVAQAVHQLSHRLMLQVGLALLCSPDGAPGSSPDGQGPSAVLRQILPQPPPYPPVLGLGSAGLARI